VGLLWASVGLHHLEVLEDFHQEDFPAGHLPYSEAVEGLLVDHVSSLLSFVLNCNS
jgi:hypothetical protein